MRYANTFIAILSAALAATLSLSVFAADAPPQTYALIVAGEGGEANFSENYKDWTVRLHKVLAGHGIPAAHIRVLMEKQDAAPCCNGIASRENFLKACAEIARQAAAADRFMLFFIGHGTALNNTGKLCVPGADIDSADVAAALDKILAQAQFFLNSTALSGSYLEKCSRPGRIIATATNNSSEGNETYFMEFFLRGIESKAADADKDGRASVLEAFNYAAIECPKWYLRQYLQKDGVWRVEGKLSRELWEKFYGKITDKKLAPAADPNAADAEPQLGAWGPQWEGRRMPTEHAQLDDNGDKQGTAVFVNNEFHPIVGTEETADGFAARTFIIGEASK